MAVISIKNGKSNTVDSNSTGEFIFFDRSKEIKKSDKFLFDGEYIIVPGEGDFTPKYFNGKFDLHQRTYAIKSNNTNKLLNKYLYYFLIKYSNNFKKYSVGSTVPSLRISSFNWVINNKFVSLEIQNQIIDIIKQDEKLFLRHSNCVRIDTSESVQVDMKNLIDIIKPIEDMKDRLMKQLSCLSKYSELILNQYSILEKMNKNCIFVKGNSVNNFSEGKTLFLNVAAANGNPNKYCENEANIFPKDITLSLDGNTGLVNNNLLGFNGYLYKVASKVIPNWQIYYSLKHKVNQNIIKLNETGTTIKHSNNSRKELLLLIFKQREILQNLFDLEVNLKQQIDLLDKQIKKTIELLIK
ncbi:restriction endonuclease subunit S [Spiroplasma attinicola]|uniref:restriction endonuclease subunit S n=1 Tax=Spiroplasma attinicola TaxID=2904537 RepID=UPI002022B729|nr:restriction endonuclease subunit S [Spiroplasma sp. JKS002670]MCL8209774.1 hypothetical protein [Spiroplasma sp. JKS002670]